MSLSRIIYDDILIRYGDRIAHEQTVIASYQKAKRPYNLWIWSALGGFIATAIGHTWLYGIGGALISMFIIALIRPKYRKNSLLAGDISEKAILEISKNYFSKPSFDYFGGMKEEEFQTLFDEYFDDYWSDSELKGVHNGIKFRICNVEASYEEEYDEDYTDSDGNTYTETHTETVEVFNGSILRMTLPVSFKESIVIGNFKSKETMDHQHFNKCYGVNAYDRVYARYLLTQSFMDQLVRLAYSLGDVPKIVFEGKYIYILMDRKVSFEDVGFFSIESDIEGYEHEIRRINTILKTIAFYDHHIMVNNDKGTR